MNKTRVIFISILVGIVAICAVVIFLVATSEERARNRLIKSAEKDANSTEKKKDFTNIDVDKYLKLYAGNDKSVVLIGRSGCEFCKIADPIIQGIAYDNNLKVYYLSTDGFSDEDKTNLLNSDEYFKEKEGMPTPLLLVVGDSKIHDKVEGLVSKDEYIEFLDENGII